MPGEDAHPSADGFGESSDEEEEKSPPVKRKKETSKLPSADELLAESKPSAWLAKPKWSVKPSPLPKIAVESSVAMPIPAESVVDENENEYGDDMYESYDPAKGWQGKQSTNFADDTAGYGGGGARSSSGGGRAVAAPPPQKKKKREFNEAKERVKQQRLAGQSGIGGDFREWRSEEEMRMRQQYD